MCIPLIRLAQAARRNWACARVDLWEPESAELRRACADADSGPHPAAQRQPAAMAQLAAAATADGRRTGAQTDRRAPVARTWRLWADGLGGERGHGWARREVERETRAGAGAGAADRQGGRRTSKQRDDRKRPLGGRDAFGRGDHS